MEYIEIKKVSLNDLEALKNIGKETFYETFSVENTEEDMQAYLNESFNTKKLTTELKNTNSEFYFAILHNKVIGYTKLNYGTAQTEVKDKNALEIERIYVLKEFHGRQVGQLLHNNALELAKQTNLKYLWLGVWEKNQRAISFYEKNGFIAFDKHIFKLGNDEQIDIMMKLELK